MTGEPLAICQLRERVVDVIGAAKECVNRKGRDKMPFTGGKCSVDNLTCNDPKHPYGYRLCKECQFRTKRKYNRLRDRFQECVAKLQTYIKENVILFMSGEKMKL